MYITLLLLICRTIVELYIILYILLLICRTVGIFKGFDSAIDMCIFIRMLHF